MDTRFLVVAKVEMTMTDTEKGTVLLLVHAKATANLPYFCEAVKSNVISITFNLSLWSHLLIQ